MGGFGITPLDDLLNIQDVVLVQQDCTETFVAFDDDAVARFFDDQVDLGRQPAQFGRIWIHTHPGSSAEPSHADLETFQGFTGAAPHVGGDCRIQQEAARAEEARHDGVLGRDTAGGMTAHELLVQVG